MSNTRQNTRILLFIYKHYHVFNKHFWLNEVLCYV